MGRRLILGLLLVLIIGTAGCGPETKGVYSDRYKLKATRDEVFNQSLQAIARITRAADTETDLAKGYIKSLPFVPPDKQPYPWPTRYYLEVFVKKEQTSDSFYVPDFQLRAEETRDKGRTWEQVNPHGEYKAFLEEDLEKRVMWMVTGILHPILPKNFYLGFVIISPVEQIYEDPDTKAELLQGTRYQFGELQFSGFKPLMQFKNELLLIKLWLPDDTRKVGWISEYGVRTFMFKVPPWAGNPEAWKEMYRREFIKGVSRTIGLHRGETAKWPPEIMAAIRKGEVLIGMTDEQVVAAVGPPDESRSIDGPEPGQVTSIYTYKYAGRIYKRVYLIDRKVINHTGGE